MGRFKNAGRRFGDSFRHQIVNAIEMEPTIVGRFVGGMRGVHQGKIMNRRYGVDEKLNRGRNFLTGAVRGNPLASAVYGAVVDPKAYRDVVEYAPTRKQIIISKKVISK